MIYRHSQEQIDNYYAANAMNQSSLRVIIQDGIQEFLIRAEGLKKESDLYYSEKEHFIIGSGADTIVSQGIETYEKKYFSSKLSKKPGEKSMSVLQLAFNKAKETYHPDGPDVTLTAYKKEVWEACNQEGYYSNQAKDSFEEDNRIGRILKENGQEYWAEMCLAEGKQLLTEFQDTLIKTIAHNWMNHPYTAKFFQDGPDIDIVYQFPCYFQMEDIECKALIDHIYIDHSRKVISPLDEKTTTEHILRFNKAIEKRRYDLQGSWYYNAIMLCLSQLSSLVGRDLKDYRISNFAFIAESTKTPGTPLIFPLTEALMGIGKIGNGRWLLGWTQGLSIYKEWLRYGFSIEERLKEDSGIIFVEENFDYQINI